MLLRCTAFVEAVVSVEVRGQRSYRATTRNWSICLLVSGHSGSHSFSSNLDWSLSSGSPAGHTDERLQNTAEHAVFLPAGGEKKQHSSSWVTLSGKLTSCTIQTWHLCKLSSGVCERGWSSQSWNNEFDVRAERGRSVDKDCQSCASTPNCQQHS